MNMLEKAARAAAKAQGRDMPNDMTLPYGKGSRIGITMDITRAVLAAIREPSMAQLAAAQAAWLNDPEKKSSTIYTAMIDAILKGETTG